MFGAAEMSVGSSKHGAFFASLVLFCIGCVNLDKPATVETCGNVGTCRNGKDAGTSRDTDMNPDGDVSPVDALKSDAVAVLDTLVVSPDTKTTVMDSKPDPTVDVPADIIVVDTQTLVNTDASLDTTAVKPVDAGTPDASTGPVDTRTDTTTVSDTSLAPTDTKPAVDVGPATTVIFSAGRGQGAMIGYGWVSLGSADTISSPTCGATTPITNAALCLSSTVWNASDALCLTGYVPALSTSAPDYVGNWGVQVGVNASEPAAAIGVSHKTITLDVTGAPQTNLRALLHRFGDLETTYCYLMTPGVPIPLTSFNTKCWEQPSSGVAFTDADAAKIDRVSVQVSSTTAGAITVSNLCLNGIVFGN